MIESVADRITKRMKELGIKQVDLINKKVASKGTISLWLSGGAVPSGERLVKLSNELNVDAAWILTGQGKMSDRFDNSVDLSSVATVTYAPVISWVQAGDFTDMESISNLAECEKLPLVPGAGKKSFYLEVKGLSNAPYFEEGEKICIDPDYQLSLVTSYNHDYLWILSRSPNPPKAKVDALVAKARGLGFATDKLIWVNQPG